ncbi:MAG: hypothetical protein IJK07_06140 [Bacteroidales bacterium]|nr:hypothetical protein [Bacteroidales bacterium]
MSRCETPRIAGYNSLFLSTSTARCTVYVRYMYGICTLPKRTNTVHIAYIYRTTGREKPVFHIGMWRRYIGARASLHVVGKTA